MVEGRVEEGKRGSVCAKCSEDHSVRVLRTKQMDNHSEDSVKQTIGNAFEWHYIDGVEEKVD